MKPELRDATISAYFDDQLDASQFEVLRAWILADDANAVLFLRRAAMHWQAREHFRAAELVAMMGQDDLRCLDELESSLGPIDMETVIIAAAEDSELSQARQAEARAREIAQVEGNLRSWDTLAGQYRFDTTPVRHLVIPTSLVYGLGAALLLLAVYTFWGSRPVQPVKPEDAKIAAAPSPAMLAAIGRVTGSVQAVWEGHVALAVGQDLSNEPMRLKSGVVELTFEHGAQMLVEGPATFVPRSADRLELTLGRMTGDVPVHARGFTVDTPYASVIDLGTAFGVHVTPSAAMTDVHVFKGEVAMASAGPARAAAPVILKQGEAKRADARGLQRLDFNDKPFLRHLPTSYELAIRQSDPVAYWSLSEAKGDRVFVNRARVGSDARLTPGVRIADEVQIDGTLGPVAFFNGAESAVHAGMLEGWEDTANFTLEAWVRPVADAEGNLRIISNRDPEGGFALGIAGRNNTVMAPEMTALFSFFLVKDYSSAVVIPADRWSHLVVTVDNAGVPSFFVDGQKVGTYVRTNTKEYSPLGGRSVGLGLSSRQPLVIGNNPAMPPGVPVNHLREDVSGFHGGIDHVAIYDRVLTDEEVQMHHIMGSGILPPTR